MSLRYMLNNGELYQETTKILCDVSGTIVAPGFYDVCERDIRFKDADASPVTAYDKQAEEAIKSRLKRLTPGSGFIGEETTDSRIGSTHITTQVYNEELLWVIDPIDGTGNFARGNPDFATMLALIHNDNIQAGWILNPVKDIMLFAAKDAGVFYNGYELPAVDRSPAQDSGPIRGFVTQQLLQHTRLDDRGEPGDGQLDITSRRGYPAANAYIDFLTGRIDFFVWGHANAWDHLPGLAAVFQQSANAYVSHLDGTSPYDFRHPEKGILVARDDHTARHVRQGLLTPPGAVLTL